MLAGIKLEVMVPSTDAPNAGKIGKIKPYTLLLVSFSKRWFKRPFQAFRSIVYTIAYERTTSFLVAFVSRMPRFCMFLDKRLMEA